MLVTFVKLTLTIFNHASFIYTAFLFKRDLDIRCHAALAVIGESGKQRLHPLISEPSTGIINDLRTAENKR